MSDENKPYEKGTPEYEEAEIARVKKLLKIDEYNAEAEQLAKKEVEELFKVNEKEEEQISIFMKIVVAICTPIAFIASLILGAIKYCILLPILLIASIFIKDKK